MTVTRETGSMMRTMEHPMVMPDPARVRLVGFGAYSLSLDIFAYVRCASYWRQSKNSVKVVSGRSYSAP